MYFQTKRVLLKSPVVFEILMKSPFFDSDCILKTPILRKTRFIFKLLWKTASYKPDQSSMEPKAESVLHNKSLARDGIAIVENVGR